MDIDKFIAENFEETKSKVERIITQYGDDNGLRRTPSYFLTVMLETASAKDYTRELKERCPYGS